MAASVHVDGSVTRKQEEEDIVMDTNEAYETVAVQPASESVLRRNIQEESVYDL